MRGKGKEAAVRGACIKDMRSASSKGKGRAIWLASEGCTIASWSMDLRNLV